MARPEFKWILMKEDGTLSEGEGNERSFIEAAKTSGVVDGDVWHRSNHPNPLSFWNFLLK